MGLDLRVPMAPLFDAFGVPATVTLPGGSGGGLPLLFSNGEASIDTSVIWLTPITEDMPSGGDFQRREPHRVLALRRDEVTTIPRGTVIEAAEVLGGAVQTWRVDGLERQEPDHHRVIVVLEA